jgi:flagellar biosynthesis/type III secretory pathway M-ring protein FliF/YscJ
MVEKKDYKNMSEEEKAKELSLVKETLSKVNNELKTNKDLTEEQKQELEIHAAKLAGVALSGQLQSKSQKKRTLISGIVFVAIVVALIVYFFFL